MHQAGVGCSVSATFCAAGPSRVLWSCFIAFLSFSSGEARCGYEPGGRRFESCRAHQINNLQRRVFVPEPIVNNSFATVFRTAQCRRSHVRKSAGFRAGCLAASREHLVEKQEVAGSSPAGVTLVSGGRRRGSLPALHSSAALRSAWRVAMSRCRQCVTCRIGRAEIGRVKTVMKCRHRIRMSCRLYI